MNTENENSNRSYKGWIIAAVVIVILVISGRMVLKSDWLFNKLREIAVQQANQQLQGSLSIGSIRGDVLNGFTVRSLSIRDTTATQVAQIDSINVGYDFFSVLFSPHTVEAVEVYGLNLLVEQHSDSTWNIMQLIPPSDQPAQESEPLYWYVEHFELASAAIEVQSEQYLPDGELLIDRMYTTLSAGMLETGISATLSELGFAIEGSRLPEPVDVYLAGAAQQNQYTLDSIVINTGRSMLKGSARYEEGGEIQQNLELSPLSWRDLSEYAANVPIDQNLQIELSADGTLDRLRLTLDASAADGLEQFQIQAVSSLREPMTLKELTVTAQGIDASILTGLEEAPAIRSLNFRGDGTILFQAPGESNWKGSVLVENASYPPYSFDRLNTSYTFNNGSLDVDGNVSRQNEEIFLTASIDSLFGVQPEWNFHAESNQLNPGDWLQNEQYAGNLNIRIDAMGTGFNPDDFSSSADVVIFGSQFQGQSFSRASFSGSINQSRVTGYLTAQLQESRANADFTLLDWQTRPEYDFTVHMNRVNLAELQGLEDFPTYINGTIEGSGSSFDPAQMRMMATANFDSSIVNGEEIQKLNSDIQVENEFVIVEEGLLESPIADADFSLTQHLYDITNRANQLSFEASLKDLSPLAPLFGVEKLLSEGSVNGNLGRNSEEILEFNGEIDLKNVEVDTLFSADNISGRLAAYLTNQPEFDLNVDLSEPSVYQTSVQDMQLYVYAKRQEKETTGNISIQLQNGNDSLLRQSGEFAIDSTRSTLLTQTLEFETRLRELTLERPFRATYTNTNNTISVDTLTISTDQGDAHLRLWAPHIDSLRQEGGMDAQNLNVGVLQQTILKESYFDGFLDGSVQIYNSPDSLDLSASGEVTQLKLSNGQMDSLKINMDIRNEWLTADLQTWNAGAILAEGSFKVPFLPGDPLTFDDQFFEGKVSGQFQLYESPLNYWLSFMPEGGPEGTEGLITSQFELGGIAGNPDIDGKITITNGLLSGIRVDTVGVDVAYLHEEERLDFNGSIVKDRQRILNFEADLPFLVDLKRAEIHTPSNDDELFVDITTTNFDLALFNSYVNRDRIRGISGRLEGSVTLSGAMDNMQADGQMQLRRGSVRIVEAGITLSDVTSKVLFRNEAVELQQFTASSGPGQLKASGNLNLEGLEPGQMEIRISASRFQMLNTSDYNAIIQMNATMNGTFSEPQLKGSLTFLNGFYYLQDFGESAVEEVELDDQNQQETSTDFYESLDMEFTVAFNRQFFIRNQQYLDMEIELDGEVDLVKKPNQDIQVFGTLEGVEGYARPLGKEFKLEEALVSFYGPVDNLELNIRTSYTPPRTSGVTIFYIIEGTLEDPEFRFDSQPPLELQDIISYTLFGRPFYELESWEQVVAGSSSSPSAADYAMQVLLDRVEMLASQRLGVDVVRIDNSRAGSNNTVIETGWYLNQSTFFAILTEIGGASPKTLFMLEIMLQDNLELIITQGDDTRQGIDLQWRRDY